MCVNCTRSVLLIATMHIERITSLGSKAASVPLGGASPRHTIHIYTAGICTHGEKNVISSMARRYKGMFKYAFNAYTDASHTGMPPLEHSI